MFLFLKRGNCKFNVFPARKLHQGCIIGSGPSGMYLASSLTKASERLSLPIKIDIYEKLKMPFGLVRYGVAPDHQDVKNVTSSFEKILEKENVNLLAGVDVGLDVTLEDIKKAYDFVVLCYGQFLPKYLNIDGESLNNIYTAKDFVGWYNGFPSKKPLYPNLNVKNVVLIGLGNVSIDVARIILSKHDELYSYDIPQNVLKVIKASQIQSVTILGRGDILRTAFTVKELREFNKKLDNGLYINSEDTSELDFQNLPREKKRLFELLKTISINSQNVKNHAANIQYNKVPLKFFDDGNGNVKAIELFDKITNENVIIPCDLAVTCIGYHGCSIDPSITFDSKNKCILNENGRIISNENKQPIHKMYCNGWLKTGPQGNIASTMVDSFNTCDTILSDIKSGVLNNYTSDLKGSDYICQILHNKDITPITYYHWKLINEREQLAGKILKKIREKIVDPEKLSSIISDIDKTNAT